MPLPTVTISDEKTLVVPTVHLNGTGAKGLLEQYRDAFSAVQTAIRALTDSAPHGRDYYIHGMDAYQKARQEHLDRLKRLQSVAEEILALHDAVSDQRRK